jgi:hypothetical protein
MQYAARWHFDHFSIGCIIDFGNSKRACLRLKEILSEFFFMGLILSEFFLLMGLKIESFVVT